MQLLIDEVDAVVKAVKAGSNASQFGFDVRDLNRAGCQISISDSIPHLNQALAAKVGVAQQLDELILRNFQYQRDI